jgi:O-antigen ligase
MLVLKSAPFLPVAAAVVSEVVMGVALFLQEPHNKTTAASAGKDRNRIIVPIYSKMGANRQPVAAFCAFNFVVSKLHFYLLLAVIGTTLVSWFQLNSILIIVLTGCRLLQGGSLASNLRRAFSDGRFLAFFALFLWEAGGLLYTHNPYMGWKHVESKATLVAIPFIICSGSFADGPGFSKLMWAYCRLLAVICLWCLGAAFVQYLRTGDVGEFFYHALTESVHSNAVFFSAYVLMALLFLLSEHAAVGQAPKSEGRRRSDGRARERIGMLFFFTGMMVLLASKLLLVLLVIIFAVYLWRSRKAVSKWRSLGLAVCLILGTVLMGSTDNPVVRRYKDIFVKERTVERQSVGHLFNGLSLRLFIWRTADDILHEHRAWMFGVSAGDSQNLLDERYYRVGMDKGFLGYNFHNEYIELLVYSGCFGLAVFLGAMMLLCWSQRWRAGLEGWFAIVVILLLACTESSLEMQQPAFLSCFFPLLAWRNKAYSPRRAIPSLSFLPDWSRLHAGHGS